MSQSFHERHPLLDWIRRAGQMFWVAGARFFSIDGEQRAAAFAYYAFFALFPLILLLVTIGSQFWDSAAVINYIISNLGHYVPFNTADRDIVDRAIHGIVDSRGGVSFLAILGLMWSSSNFLHSMVRGVNSAWGTIEYPWWRLPMQSFLMLGLVASALFIGVLVPLVLSHLRHVVLMQGEGFSTLFDVVSVFVPSLVLFYGFSMFFKFAPRRRTQFSEVALSAFLTTVLLQMCRHLFGRYVYDLSNFNAIYGTVAIVIVFLMWIYLSGVIIIYGGCLCAAHAEVFGKPIPPPVDIKEEFDDRLE